MNFLDLTQIGHSVYNQKGFAVFVTDEENLIQKERELKEIFLILGGKFSVTDSYDLLDCCDSCIETNMPYALYKSLTK